MKYSILLLFICSLATSASATTRDSTIEALESLATASKSESVRIQVNGGAGEAVRIGDEIAYRFESDQSGYLTAIHVDIHGSATLLYPRADAGSSQLSAGQAVSFPGHQDSFSLEVEPPVGQDVVYAFISDRPIERSELGLDDSELVVSFEPQQAPAFVAKLAAVLNARGADHYRANKISQRVDGRGVVQYRSADIANFFGERTRSIKPAKLDLQIQFARGSAELDATARKNIDEFAAALEDPRLKRMRFAVSGHTDTVGTEEHNATLSRRRAESVHKHLVESGGIAPERLAIEAHGEAAPLITDESDYAHQMNRRVEFKPIRR